MNVKPAGYAESLLNAARPIRLLVLDVDGVLTDGGLYFDEKGNVSKRFDVQDGLGIVLAHNVGLRVAVITGLESPAVTARVRQLKIDDYYAGIHYKKEKMLELIEKYSLKKEEIAYIGDDWLDLMPMSMSGLAVAVANAQPEVKAAATMITENGGGHGAVRELIRLILQAKGLYGKALQEWQE